MKFVLGGVGQAVQLKL